MSNIRGAYGSLMDYLSTQPTLKQLWSDLSLSFSERVKGQISRYLTTPDRNLPPVFKLTREQRDKYSEIYGRLSEQYKKLADIAHGVPLPTDKDSQQLLDVINWIDNRDIDNGTKKIRGDHNWNFGIAGSPTNLVGLVVTCLKDRTFDSEALTREMRYIRKLLEENPI